VIIVASVSCIYGIGAAECTRGMTLELNVGREPRDALLRRLVELQYERNDIDFHRGTFRVRGDVVEVFPAYEETRGGAHRVLGRRDRAIREIDRCAARCSKS
jgi:excinuclease ABC subunit B